MYTSYIQIIRCESDLIALSLHLSRNLEPSAREQTTPPPPGSLLTERPWHYRCLAVIYEHRGLIKFARGC